MEKKGCCQCNNPLENSLTPNEKVAHLVQALERKHFSLSKSLTLGQAFFPKHNSDPNNSFQSSVEQAEQLWYLPEDWDF